MLIIDKLGTREVESFNHRTHKYDWDLGQVIELSQAEKQAWVQNDEHNKQKQRIPVLRKILTAYTEDFAQSLAGLYIADLEERKEKFRQAHAELRQLEGKETRLLE